MANKADFHPTASKRSPLGWLWANRSPAERVVLRDIWLYCSVVFGIGCAIGGVGSLLVGEFLYPFYIVLTYACVVGAVLIHLITLDRWARARGRGAEPDLTRIFE